MTTCLLLLVGRIVDDVSVVLLYRFYKILFIVVQPNHKKVIDENFGHIYCHLVCSCVSDREMQTVINYLEVMCT